MYTSVGHPVIHNSQTLKTVARIRWNFLLSLLKDEYIFILCVGMRACGTEYLVTEGWIWGVNTVQKYLTSFLAVQS